MLDAEGTITGAGIGPAAGNHIRVSIANINKDLIVWIAQTLGGVVMIRKIEGKYPLYLWRPPSERITLLMKLLIPFLRVKQRQARLAQVFRTQVERNVPRLKRARTVRKIQNLNLRSGKMIESKPTTT
jgi:hypothetical protein